MVVLACFNVRQRDCLQSNGFACMKLLSEVYLVPRNNLIHFRGDLDYDQDPDPGSGSALLCLLPMNEVYQDTGISNRISDQYEAQAADQYEADNIHQNTITIAGCKCVTHSMV